MKDEIKEILDRLENIDHKEYSCSFEFADTATFTEMAMCFEERKKMANYIINLQEENERLKEINKEQANHLISKDNLSYEDYKSRNEKAIEYIKECIDSEDIYEQFLSTGETQKLLNILQGDDKDE